MFGEFGGGIVPLVLTGLVHGLLLLPELLNQFLVLLRDAEEFLDITVLPVAFAPGGGLGYSVAMRFEGGHDITEELFWGGNGGIEPIMGFHAGGHNVVIEHVGNILEVGATAARVVVLLDELVEDMENVLGVL